jgi:DivIVA domain-containing protein
VAAQVPLTGRELSMGMSHDYEVAMEEGSTMVRLGTSSSENENDRLTPLEVRKKKGDFRRIMRGYDPGLVDDFLDLVADRLEELVRENLSLAERVARQDQQVAEYRERERR